jgi:hypothetical protein
MAGNLLGSAWGSLGSSTTGANNVAVGRSALSANTTGGSNVAVGYSSLQERLSREQVLIEKVQALELHLELLECRIEELLVS